MKQFKYILLIILFITALPANAQLVLNEFMADNAATIVDESDGKYDDWIEIYNMGGSSANLKDYALSDDPETPDKWLFPDIELEPGGFLLIWLDGDTDLNYPHASFKLSKNGEFIGLYYNSAPVDTLTFPAQTTDVSYGRISDGDGAWDFLANPTPNNSNNSEIAVDSSAIIFDDSMVHDFKLEFYVDAWADSLKYNYENDEEYMPAKLTYGSITLDSIGVRYKGNSSYSMARNTPKKPFKFKFDKYIDDRTFYGIKRLNFSNCAKDPTYLREKIGYYIAGKYLPVPRTAYSNIYINGELIGFYLHIEQVDKTFLSRHFETNGNNLYKAGDNGTGLIYKGDQPSAYYDEIVLKTNEDENDYSALIDLLDKLQNTTDKEFLETMENKLNLDNVARHLAFNMALSHFDSYTGSGRNFYLYDDSSSAQFNIIHWDLNETFGSYSNQWNVSTQDLVTISNLNQRPLNRRIVENDSLRQVYLRYVKDMIEGPASYDSVESYINKYKDFIAPYIQADDNKLFTYQQFLTNFEDEVNLGMGQRIPGLLSFIEERSSALEQQLDEYLEPLSVETVNDISNIIQIFPNPINTGAAISFDCPEFTEVDIKIYNPRGDSRPLISRQNYDAGKHEIYFDASGFNSGIYYLAITINEKRYTRIINIIK